MDTTPNLKLPFIAPAQAQKHVTHNEALLLLDAAVNLGVVSRTVTSPPADPAEGTRYIAASAATDAWLGHDHEICVWQDGAWTFLAPLEGWLVWIADESLLVAWNGSAWIEAVSIESINPAELVGVNTVADASNRLSVKSDQVLHSHDDVTPGSGDARHLINKALTTNTASLLFQTGYSGRDEFGLAGNDNWQVKVSADGIAWQQALEVDNATGHVGVGISAPAAPLHVAGDDQGLSLENTQDPGQSWTIGIGRPGMYEDQLIISTGTDIATPANHLLRIPKTYAPTFTNGIQVTDGEPIGSETSGGLANYKPWTGSRGELSFRGPDDSGTAEFRIYAFIHDGAFQGKDAGVWKADADGARLGINTFSPTTTLHVEGPARIGNYYVGNLPDATTSGAGSIIYLTDETGGPVLAFSDGTDWRRSTDRNIVS